MRKTEYKYNVGDIVKLSSGRVIISEQIRLPRGKNKKTEKGYVYKCLICKQVDKKFEYVLSRGIACSICTNFKIKIGYNDMWTTNPKLASLLANPDDGYLYTQGSGIKVNWKCPDCNEIIKNKSIDSIKRYMKLSCSKCSDGFSYPEKFIYNLLTQLNIKFKYQYSPEWIKPKRYDFCLYEFDIIIEVHGEQHYIQKFFNKKSKILLEEVKNNDVFKEQLAKKNGIINDNYVIIDARKSELKWIKHMILQSKLNVLFNLSKINWNQCHEFACCNLVKIISNLWNKQECASTSRIKEIVNLSKHTIIKYLKQGSDLGWCNYSSKAESLKYQYPTKKIVQINTSTNKMINIFNTISNASLYLKISASHISSCCRNKRKSAGGYKWMYLSDYDKLQSQQDQTKHQTQTEQSTKNVDNVEILNNNIPNTNYTNDLIIMNPPNLMQELIVNL